MSQVTSRRIEKSCQITVNLSDMQFIRIGSRIEQDVCCLDGELQDIEDKLWHDIAKDLRRGLIISLSDLGKTTESDRKFFDTCKAKVEQSKVAAAKDPK